MSKVKNTLELPYRWICSIRVDFDEKNFKTPTASREGDTRFSTGLLITASHLLTAAHNLVGVKKYKGKWLVVRPQRITVTPGRDDNRLDPSPFGTYRASEWVWPRGYNAYRNGEKSAPYDYAILTLKGNPGRRRFTGLGSGGSRRQLGWWSRSYSCYIRPVEGTFRTSLGKKIVNVCGYPFDADSEFSDRKTPAGVQEIDHDSVSNVSKTLLRHQAHASDGQSGAPVWARDRNGGNRYLVGIHRATHQTWGDSSGVLMNQDVVDQIVEWIGDAKLLSLSKRAKIS